MSLAWRDNETGTKWDKLGFTSHKGSQTLPMIPKPPLTEESSGRQGAERTTHRSFSPFSKKTNAKSETKKAWTEEKENLHPTSTPQNTIINKQRRKKLLLTSQPDSNKDAISLLLRFAPQKTRSLLLLLLLYLLPISPQYRALQALTWKCALGAAAAAAHRRDNKSRERKRTTALKLSLAEDDKLHIGQMDADKNHWSLGFRTPREDTDRWTKRPTEGFNQKFSPPGPPPGPPPPSPREYISLQRWQNARRRQLSIFVDALSCATFPALLGIYILLFVG